MLTYSHLDNLIGAYCISCKPSRCRPRHQDMYGVDAVNTLRICITLSLNVLTKLGINVFALIRSRISTITSSGFRPVLSTA